MIKPDIGYFRFHDIVKTGLLINYSFPAKIETTSINKITLGLEGNARIYSSDDWTELTSIIATITFTGDVKNTLVEILKDTNITPSITIGGSFSKELFSTGVAGAFIDFEGKNFRLFENHFFSGSIGVAYNYHYSLYRMPIMDQILIPVKLRWMF